MCEYTIYLFVQHILKIINFKSYFLEFFILVDGDILNLYFIGWIRQIPFHKLAVK